MGCKSKNTSLDIRQLVIFHRGKGKSYLEIGKLLNISQSSVANIIQRYKYEDRIVSIPQKGRPRVLDSREKRAIIRKIKINPGLSAPALTTELAAETGKKVHVDTVRNVLKNAGYNSRTARKKPYINEMNRKKRITFTKEFISEPQLS
ncbi:uncharacterized protein LOC143265686 [Megachile rotundata]|uniref:uncharacterized protein LOC143265686 n=1 Tax=Megachile rotundata TaxID=143995 RepID=UPI003FD5A59E